MRSGWLFGAALACCFVLGWGARGATDVRKPVSVTRIYTGSDGLSHAEEIRDMKLMPDAARNGLEASDVIKVTGLRFARISPGWVRDWHVAERHQYIVTLSGKGEIELVGAARLLWNREASSWRKTRAGRATFRAPSEPKIGLR
jgi:hypothetical protein